MSSIVGIDGLLPTMNIIKHTRKIAIANKESIICGWNLIKKNLNKYNFEKTINWKIAIIKDLNEYNAILETSEGVDGVINFNDIYWTKKRPSFLKVFVSF